ncbi:hypothetical protein DFH29DRAFT_909002 [Suillus ampliporus]|nr:hypothetical protein DFH29DRAFT_909002 [Suillus ampliporus]
MLVHWSSWHCASIYQPRPSLRTTKQQCGGTYSSHRTDASSSQQTAGSSSFLLFIQVAFITLTSSITLSIILSHGISSVEHVWTGLAVCGCTWTSIVLIALLIL